MSTVFLNTIPTEGRIDLLRSLDDKSRVTTICIGQPLTYEVWHELCKALARNCSLTFISIMMCFSDSIMNDDIIEMLTESLYNNTRLIALDLSSHLESNGAKCISNMLLRNNTLLQLDLSRNRIDDNSIEYISQSLENHHSHLTHINLSNRTFSSSGRSKPGISSSGIERLFMSLRFNSALTCLLLENSDVTDKDVLCISSCLKENRSLKKLGLDDNKIGNDGATALFELLTYNYTLTEIALINNLPIDKSILDDISNSLNRNSHRDRDISNSRYNQYRENYVEGDMYVLSCFDKRGIY